MMLSFICLFFPAVLFAWAFEGMTGKDLSLKKWFCLYCTGVISVNLMCWVVRRVFSRAAYAPLYSEGVDITQIQACYYLLLAVPFALLFAALAALLSKKVRIKVEDENDAGE